MEGLIKRSTLEKSSCNTTMNHSFFMKERGTGIGAITRDFIFLDATTHLYKRSCPSVRRSVRRSVCPALLSNDEYGRF